MDNYCRPVDYGDLRRITDVFEKEEEALKRAVIVLARDIVSGEVGNEAKSAGVDEGTSQNGGFTITCNGKGRLV